MAPRTKSLKIIIVEDQKLFQELLTHIAVNEFGHEVIGIATNGMEAIQLCREENPDLLLLDLLIPKISGLVVAENLRHEIPDLRILAISSEVDPLTVYRAFEIGLNGFLDKGSQSIEKLTDAIESVGKGKTYFSEVILEERKKLLKEPLSFQKILSPREQEVLSLIGGCYSDQEIGEFIGLSSSTVQTHRKHIMHKTNTHSTPALIKYALENGFWKPHEKRLENTW